MKTLPFIVALSFSCLGPALECLAQEKDAPTSDDLGFHWYIRSGFVSVMRQSLAPKDSESGLLLEAVKTSDHRLLLQPGVVLEMPKNDRYAARARLELLGSADSQTNAWKSFWETKDYDHFPLALHKTGRNYRIQSQFNYFLSPELTPGLEVDYDWTRGGFSFGRKERDLESRDSELGQAYRLKPKMDLRITSVDQLEFYGLFLKNLDKTTDLNTFKTYDSKKKSFGLQYERTWDDPDLGLRLHGFRYHFIFNDISKDFTRTGLVSELKYRLLDDKLSLAALGGYWQDRFELPTPRVRDCQSSIVENSENEDLVFCSRQEQRKSLAAQIEYDIKDNLRLSFRYSVAKNENDRLKVYDFDQQRLVLALTWSGEESKAYMPQDESERLEGLDLLDGR
jgi:hypothetical protein